MHTDPSRELALWIRPILAGEIEIAIDQRAFMEATFGTTDLASILGEAGGCESDSLLDLLFFPDQALMIRYEALWGDQPFCPQDQAAVVAELASTALTAHLSLGPGSDPFAVVVPCFVLEAFVQRLNITWQAPSQIRHALASMTDSGQKNAILASIRHAPLEWHLNQIDLMVHFLEKMPSHPDDQGADLAFLLSLLPELTLNHPPYEFLIAKKAFYFQSLCKAEEFERRCRSEPMEILMLQGYRTGCGSMDQWRQSMSRIDRLCLTLFGRTQFFHHPLSISLCTS